MAGTRARRARPAHGEGREALLRATIRVVARDGLRRLTMRAVATEANVTHPLVVHHFGTRDRLLDEAFRYSIVATETIASPTSQSGSIEDFAAGAERIVAEDPELQAFQYELILESRRRPELAVRVRELYHDWHEITRNTLTEFGITDPAATTLVFATLDGLVFQQLVLGTEAEHRRALDLLRQIVQLLAESAAKPR